MVKLRCATFRFVCPECGTSCFLSTPAHFVTCQCGKGTIVDNNSDTLAVVAYHWACPECGRDGYESQAGPTVTCHWCGATFEVCAVEHPQQPVLI